MPLGKIMRRTAGLSLGNRALNSHSKRKLKQHLFGGQRTKKCCFCRRILTIPDATLDHILPHSQGGDWSLSNLRIACEDCNHQRQGKDFEEFRKEKRRTTR